MAQADGFPSQLDEQAWASQSSDLIRFKQFEMGRRGYDPDEVREYLAHARGGLLKGRACQPGAEIHLIQRAAEHEGKIRGSL